MDYQRSLDPFPVTLPSTQSIFLAKPWLAQLVICSASSKRPATSQSYLRSTPLQGTYMWYCSSKQKTVADGGHRLQWGLHCCCTKQICLASYLLNNSVYAHRLLWCQPWSGKVLVVGISYCTKQSHKGSKSRGYKT